MRKLLLLMCVAICSNSFASTTYFSDGSYATTYGNTTYFSDGSYATTY